MPPTQACDELLAPHKPCTVVRHHADDARMGYAPSLSSHVAGQYTFCDGKPDGHQSRQRDLFGLRTLRATHAMSVKGSRLRLYL